MDAMCLILIRPLRDLCAELRSMDDRQIEDACYRDLVFKRIAEHYGIRTVNVLTGFKFIGEIIWKACACGGGENFICGFEESYGYLTGSYVRDKDAGNAVLMIAEMFAYYRTRGINFPGKLEELYRTYGYCLNTLHSYEFPGSSGMAEMLGIMESFRKRWDRIGPGRVVKTEDYLTRLNGLPPSDVLKFSFEWGGGESRKNDVSGSIFISMIFMRLTSAKSDWIFTYAIFSRLLYEP